MTSVPATVIALKSLACIADDRSLLEIDELTVGAGERIAIVGHNGAGKTTLLRLLSGCMRPAHGSAEVLGRALQDALPAAELRALRQEVGQVLQGVHLVARLSAIENALIGSLGRVTGWRSWMRWYPAQEVAQAEAALQAVGLLAHAYTRADKLSGGEKQKVAIARLLMQRPRLILADEPTAALDPSGATEVCRLLVKAARRATLITVVHSPALLPLLAERVIGLKQGRIAFDLPLASVGDHELGNLYRSAGGAVRALASPAVQSFSDPIGHLPIR
ncbi:MAG: ATP-binding cassette domain-containing protein [Candidatus Accumulibacter sp.]|jgi:phosphonate transport system ATP-binding protein|uniref:ATP-binding cassette domain-containing protein n=1 Tax=Candidatus Accumulibacter affinis TaxID=2954384 RepID=A0A935W5N5_9PROT|nr:ATP-binding cassette domain-containing protein [Candidatus Accumulibacter affinis]MBP9806118.1 ATP-binding cassette domain-containing protein [Accumulibacter sp.]